MKAEIRTAMKTVFLLFAGTLFSLNVLAKKVDFFKEENSFLLIQYLSHLKKAHTQRLLLGLKHEMKLDIEPLVLYQKHEDIPYMDERHYQLWHRVKMLVPNYQKLVSSIINVLRSTSMKLFGEAEVISGQTDIDVELHLPGPGDNRLTLEYGLLYLCQHFECTAPLIDVAEDILSASVHQDSTQQQSDNLQEIVVHMQRTGMHWGYLVQSIKKRMPGYTAGLLAAMNKDDENYAVFLRESEALTRDKNCVTVQQLDNQLGLLSTLYPDHWFLGVQLCDTILDDAGNTRAVLNTWIDRRGRQANVQTLVTAIRKVNHAGLAMDMSRYVSGVLGLPLTTPIKKQ